MEHLTQIYIVILLTFFVQALSRVGCNRAVTFATHWPKEMREVLRVDGLLMADCIRLITSLVEVLLASTNFSENSLSVSSIFLFFFLSTLLSCLWERSERSF